MIGNFGEHKARKRTYGQIILEHSKKYPGWSTYRVRREDGKLVWCKWKITDEPWDKPGEYTDYTTLQALERSLEQEAKYGPSAREKILEKNS